MSKLSKPTDEQIDLLEQLYSFLMRELERLIYTIRDYQYNPELEIIGRVIDLRNELLFNGPDMEIVTHCMREFSKLSDEFDHIKDQALCLRSN